MTIEKRIEAASAGKKIPIPEKAQYHSYITASYLAIPTVISLQRPCLDPWVRVRLG